MEVITSAESGSITNNLDRNNESDGKSMINGISSTSLFDESLKEQTRCNLARELCLIAMNLVYENNCNPYTKDDTRTKEEFQEVLESLKVTEPSEKIISNVLNSPHFKQHAELIACVPQFFVMYEKQEQELNQCLERFPLLLKFFTTKTSLDLNNYLKEQRAWSKLGEISKTYRTLKASKIHFISETFSSQITDLYRVKILSSNCPQATLIAMRQKYNKKVIIFGLEELETEEVFDSFLEVLSVLKKQKIVIDCYKKQTFMIDSLYEKFLGRKIMNEMIFITSQNQNLKSLHFDYEKLSTSHKFSDLTPESKDLSLNQVVSFQGISLTLKDILVSTSLEVEAIPFVNLFEVDMKIGGEIQFDIECEEYVERKFLSKTLIDDEKVAMEAQEIISLSSKGFLLDAEPGAGKTTSLRRLARFYKEKYPSQWVCFIDLKEHIKAFTQTSISFDNAEVLSKFFCKKILKIKDFEAEIFKKLFSAGKVILLFDGFDEISPKYKDFVIHLMKPVKEMTPNIFWVSTRPHLAEELGNSLDLVSFTLKPFNKRNILDLLKNLSRNDKISVVAHLKLCVLIDRIMITNFESFFSPLMLTMIAEVVDGNEKPNLFKIYNRMIEKMLQRCVMKGPDLLWFLATNFNNFSLFGFYYKIAFSANFNDENDARVHRAIHALFDHLETPSNEEVVRFGVLYFDDNEKPHFINQSFSDYFIADFFKDNIFIAQHENFKTILPIFEKVLMNQGNYEMILLFVEDSLEYFDSENKNEKSRKIFDEFFRLKPFFHNLVKAGHINLISLILKNFTEDQRTFWENQDCQEISLLQYAIKYQKVEFVEKFWNLKQKIFNLKEIKEKLERSSEDDTRNVFIFAVKNSDKKVFEFLIEKAKQMFSKDELKGVLKNDVLVDSIYFNHTNTLVSFNPKFVSNEMKKIQKIADGRVS